MPSHSLALVVHLLTTKQKRNVNLSSWTRRSTSQQKSYGEADHSHKAKKNTLKENLHASNTRKLYYQALGNGADPVCQATHFQLYPRSAAWPWEYHFTFQDLNLNKYQVKAKTVSFFLRWSDKMKQRESTRALLTGRNLHIVLCLTSFCKQKLVTVYNLDYSNLHKRGYYLW